MPHAASTIILGDQMKTHTKLIGAALALLVLGACDPNATNTQRGMGAGALVGGIYGLAQDNNHSTATNVARGVAVGGIVGGLGGAILDEQQRALERSLQGTGSTVNNNGQFLTVTMPGAILFATDSATVSASGAQHIYSIGQNLQQYPNSMAQVVGHTDSTGSVAHNQDLSERRARTVAGLLVESGVQRNRVTHSGRGPHQPVATNTTPEGRAQNRRVEIFIRPISQQ